MGISIEKEAFSLPTKIDSQKSATFGEKVSQVFFRVLQALRSFFTSFSEIKNPFRPINVAGKVAGLKKREIIIIEKSLPKITYRDLKANQKHANKKKSLRKSISEVRAIRKTVKEYYKHQKQVHEEASQAIEGLIGKINSLIPIRS